MKPQPYQQRAYTIESDWSAASYWYEILALTDNTLSKVALQGLKDGSRQGDSTVRYIFSLLGIKTSFKEKGVNGMPEALLTRHSRMLNRMDYDFTNQPDLAQTLIAVCPVLGIPFPFYRLRNPKDKGDRPY